jgi:hypothetical protein
LFFAVRNNQGFGFYRHECRVLLNVSVVEAIPRGSSPRLSAL